MGTNESRGDFRKRLRAMGIEPRRVGPYTWTLLDGKTVVASGEAETQDAAKTAARAAFDALPPREDGKRRRAELVVKAAAVRTNGGAR